MKAAHAEITAATGLDRFPKDPHSLGLDHSPGFGRPAPRLVAGSTPHKDQTLPRRAGRVHDLRSLEIGS